MSEIFRWAMPQELLWYILLTVDSLAFVGLIVAIVLWRVEK